MLKPADRWAGGYHPCMLTGLGCRVEDFGSFSACVVYVVLTSVMNLFVLTPVLKLAAILLVISLIAVCGTKDIARFNVAIIAGSRSGYRVEGVVRGRTVALESRVHRSIVSHV